MDLTNAKKIMTVVGARPNFMKAAPIINAIQEHNKRLTASPAAVGPHDRRLLCRAFLSTRVSTTTRRCQTASSPI